MITETKGEEEESQITVTVGGSIAFYHLSHTMRKGGKITPSCPQFVTDGRHETSNSLCFSLSINHHTIRLTETVIFETARQEVS